VLEQLEDRNLLSGGLDTTFGNSGTIDFQFTPFAISEVNALALQSNGDIIAAGTTNAFSNSQEFALARFKPDGTLDTTYGSGGKVTSHFGASSRDSIQGVVIQPDGKLVAAGSTGPSPAHLALARYNTDGTLDTSFGSGGLVTTAFGTGDQGANAVALQADGKIVAACTANGDFALVRYKPDGSLDTTFGTGGIVETDLGGHVATVTSMVIQPDGKYVVAGSSSFGFDDLVVVRYNTDGSLDASFGSGGVSRNTFGYRTAETFNGVTLQSDGKIVTAGGVIGQHSVSDIAVGRFNPDGSLDQTFGTGGLVDSYPGVASAANAVGLTANGEIVVAGIMGAPAGTNSGFDTMVALYKTDGTLDSNFGSGGVYDLDLAPGDNDQFNALVLQPDGKLVVGGTIGGGTVRDFGLARFILPAHLTADAGGPYTISEGQSVTLDASKSSDKDGDTLTYSWDINGDGVFGDATGVNPTLTWAQLQALGIDDGPHTFNVEVQANDGHGNVGTSPPTTLTLNNTPPTAGISGPTDGYNGVQGQTRTFTFTATDPSNADTTAGFTYKVTWGDGQSSTTPAGQSGAGIQLSHAYALAGSYTVSVTATDKDGGVSAAATQTDKIQVAEQQGNNLVVGGTSANDSFIFAPGSAGSLNVTVNKKSAGTFTPPGPVDIFGYAGTDKVTLTGTTGNDNFTVNGLIATLNGFTFVGTATEGWILSGLGGNNTLTDLGTIKTASVTFTGGSGSNTLIGPNVPATWTITKANGGTLTTTPVSGTVTFSQVQNLVGGTGVDIFKFKTAGSVTSINGGGGGDWLDYSAVTVGVTVNLVTGLASNVTGTVSNIQNVRGGLGDDNLTGNGGNILVGGAGNDTLTNAYAGSAASGRSLLIGGAGSDNLTAGSAGDILIGGTTSYDTNNAALQSILAEWQSGDDYLTRFNKLEGKQQGLKYTLVWGTKVQDDNAADTLNGSTAGLDWFFANLGPSGTLDTINNLNQPGPEHVDNSP
jgi:uncharacterized delta-60 repeat protein